MPHGLPFAGNAGMRLKLKFFCLLLLLLPTCTAGLTKSILSAEKIERSGWPDANLEEKCLQKSRLHFLLVGPNLSGVS